MLAETMGLDVIAEGVEWEQTRQLRESYDCRRFQGFLFGAPMTIAEFEAILDCSV